MGLYPLLLRLISATIGPPPGILDVGHNISPRLHKQLVLELKVGELLAELWKRLPSGVVVGKVVPLDEQMPLAAPLLSLQDALGSGKMPVIEDRGQRAGCCRRVAAVSKVHDNHLVNHLGLAVCLGVERRAHTQLYARASEEVAPNMPGKQWVPVADDGGGCQTQI